VLNVTTGGWTLMNSETLAIDVHPRKVSVARATFSGDGRWVLGCVDHFLHVWNPEDGSLLHTVRLHTFAGFPVRVIRNLVATGSTIHTALRVWDLDGAYESPVPDVHVYKVGPRTEHSLLVTSGDEL